MRMKPKMTLGNPKALLYKRFTSLEKSTSTKYLYRTSNGTSWSFDYETQSFIETNDSPNSTIWQVQANEVFSYYDKLFAWDSDKNMWFELSQIDSSKINLLSVKFNNIGRYQTNKYYYVGSFDYVIKGGIEDINTQQLKGNIMQLESLNIKFYNDYVVPKKDDIVVITINGINKAFIVEDTEMTQKRQPKPLNIYYSTLNSII